MVEVGCYEKACFNRGKNTNFQVLVLLLFFSRDSDWLFCFKLKEKSLSATPCYGPLVLCCSLSSA